MISVLKNYEKNNAFKKQKIQPALRNWPVGFTFMVSFSGCECLIIAAKDKKEPDILPCGTEVTVGKHRLHFLGAFQSRWLKLANGELLQPFENKTSVTNIQVGQRFMIGVRNHEALTTATTARLYARHCRQMEHQYGYFA